MEDEMLKLQEKIKYFSHDIRTPLSIIKNEAELIALMYGERSVESLKNALKRTQDLLEKFEQESSR